MRLVEMFIEQSQVVSIDEIREVYIRNSYLTVAAVDDINALLISRQDDGDDLAEDGPVNRAQN